MGLYFDYKLVNRRYSICLQYATYNNGLRLINADCVAEFEVLLLLYIGLYSRDSASDHVAHTWIHNVECD